MDQGPTYDLETVMLKNQCPICGGDLKRETRSFTSKYKDQEYSYNQIGDWCDECDESFFGPEDLKVSKKERTDKKREIDHLLRTEEIKQFRSKMKLSQKDASILFGGGPMAFSKYERGEQSQSRSTDILMKLLLNNIISLEDIKKSL